MAAPFLFQFFLNEIKPTLLPLSIQCFIIQAVPVQQYPHNQLCFSTSVFHFLNRKPTQFPWQRRILVLYSHLFVMCTLGSIWSLFSRHLRNNLGITGSRQYKQIRLSVNKPQWGWGEGCFAPTEGLLLVYFLASTGDQEVALLSEPFCASLCTGKRGPHTKHLWRYWWTFFPSFLASLPDRELGFGGSREGDIPVGSMAPAAPSLYLWHWQIGFTCQALLTGGRKRVCMRYLALTPP